MKIKNTIIAIVALGLNASSQNLVNMYTENQLTYFGLDFTQTAFSGTFSSFGTESCSPSVLRDKYIVGWNKLVVHEKNKYNINETYQKENTNYNIELTLGINSRIDTISLRLYENKNIIQPHLGVSDISKMCMGYFF
jgi:hypothetical protein